MQRDVFGNDVVFAIAKSRLERGQWRRPSIGDAPLVLITLVADDGVDPLVDELKSRAPRPLARAHDNGEKPAGRWRALFFIRNASRQHALFKVHLGNDLAPLVPQYAFGLHECCQTKRLIICKGQPQRRRVAGKAENFVDRKILCRSARGRNDCLLVWFRGSFL